MALVMVQGHVFDTLLDPAARAQPWYVFQQIFHGSTAPGFLFASGFVAGLPRAPLSCAGHAPPRPRGCCSCWASASLCTCPTSRSGEILNEGTPAEKAAAVACDALHAIAVSQLFVLLLQRLFGRRWVWAAGSAALLVIVVSSVRVAGRRWRPPCPCRSPPT